MATPGIEHRRQQAPSQASRTGSASASPDPATARLYLGYYDPPHQAAQRVNPRPTESEGRWLAPLPIFAGDEGHDEEREVAARRSLVLHATTGPIAAGSISPDRATCRSAALCHRWKRRRMRGAPTTRERAAAGAAATVEHDVAVRA